MSVKGTGKATLCMAACAAAFLSCSCEGADSGSPTANEGSPESGEPFIPSYPEAGEAEAEAGLPVPDVEAPAGWHLWDQVPADVAIFVPDDIATVQPLEWEPCPFMPEGCEQAGAPWAEETGWGFSSRIFTVKTPHSSLYMAARETETDWTEAIVFRNDLPVAAWRCHRLKSQGWFFPRPGQDGLVAVSVVRVDAFTSPIVYIGSPETIIDNPTRVERFGPPNAALLPSGVLDRSDRLLLLREEYGRLTVRDLATGTTYRPEVPEIPGHSFAGPQPIGDSMYFGAWTGSLGSLWLWRSGGEEGHYTKLLFGEPYSYDFPASDGEWLAWLRGKDWLGTNQFQTIELWASRVSQQDLAALEPRKIADLPGTWLSDLSVGNGWVAWRPTFEEVHLFRLNDGDHRMLPTVDGLAWYGGGPNHGLVISGEKVWLSGSPSDHGNSDARWLFRIDIDALEALP